MREHEHHFSTLEEVNMEKRILQGLLVSLGLAAIGIGLMIFIFGGGSTGRLTELAFNFLAGVDHKLTGQYSPTVESELRFYSPFWITYGGLLIYVARDLSSRDSWMPLLTGVFFAGGVGRAIAYFDAGPPHPAFIVLMAVEIVLPFVFVALWVFWRRHPAATHSADSVSAK
jgi:hypothetical protein